MATDVAVEKLISADVSVAPMGHISKASLVLSPMILRRAYDPQQCFACQKVESVAKTTAFVSPAALSLRKVFSCERGYLAGRSGSLTVALAARTRALSQFLWL